MKIFLLFLYFHFCFSNIFEEMRIDMTHEVLLDLPKRENVGLLEMVNEMSKIKDQYSMTELETAYFIFNWISQSIKYDCYGRNHGGIINEPFETYREGRGGYKGITELYTTICRFLNIESHTIFGIEKYLTNDFENLIGIREKYWNTVFINGNYYIADIVTGMGYCTDDNFNYPYVFDNREFGLNPESFIRYRFPNDINWQLISKPITKAEFNSMAYLYDTFFIFFKTIYPDVLSLRKGEELIEIILTFKEPMDSIKELGISAEFNLAQPREKINVINLLFSKDTLKFSLYINKSGYITINLRLNFGEYYLVTYAVY